MTMGTFGVGEIGRFSRILPPRTRVAYDAGYELAIEVKRWFYYRHGIDISIPNIVDHRNLEEVLMSGYRLVFRKKMRYWHFLSEQVEANIREFKETFKDVIAEMEFTR